MRKSRKDSAKSTKVGAASTASEACPVAPAPPPPERMRLPLDETVDDVLAASASIHNVATTAIKAADGGKSEGGSVTISIENLKKIKKQASKINKGTALYAREIFRRENRFIIEAHILRTAMKRDTTDRDATRSAIYTILRDKFEEHKYTSKAMAGGTDRSDDKSNALDRALCMNSRIQTAMLELAPGNASNMLPGASMLERMENYKRSKIL